MDTRAPHVSRVAAVIFLLLAGAWPVASVAQVTPPAAAPAAAPTFGAEEIEQLVAPIALHPDALVSQILMAATYPLQVVEAARWAKANPEVKDKALTAALEAQTWDPSVKSLVGFPQVLAMMDENLEWTQKLGDAMLAQQKDVLAAIQKLRGKAEDAGNLKTSKEQTVVVEESTQTIIIESAEPEVIYVPVYNPTVVYGSWPYPAYPPYYWYPPGYPPRAVAYSFAAGVAVGAAWGYAWGNCNWHGGDIDIDVDHNYKFNGDIDRGKYKNELASRADGSRVQNGKGAWQHDPKSRKGVAYRDAQSASRYGGVTQADARARQAYRGHADAGRRDIQSGRVPASTPATRPAGTTPGAARPSTGAARPSSGATRPSTGTTRAATPTQRPAAGASGSSQGARAFEGYKSGSTTQRESSRGQTSRQRSASPTVRSGASRSSAGSRGVSRPSGGARGGARGGGRGGGRGR